MPTHQTCLKDEQLLINHSHAELALWLKAAADPLRLDILRVLAQGSFGVLELCGLFNIKQSGMSHHLKVLTTAGLLTTRREGNSIFYRRTLFSVEHPWAALQQQLLNTLDQVPLSDNLTQALTALQNERSSAAKQFFVDNATKFRAKQDLIASFPIYGEQVKQLLSNTTLPARQRAIEVGPGEGELLPFLCSQFTHVLAIDNAPTMLACSELFAREQALNNIEFMLGDTTDLTAQAQRADCIVVNMVLHHTPSPAEIFQQLSQCLTTGGALLITDLCRHEQTWAQQACGDLWQGFEPEELTRWASAAGLIEGQAIYIALRNGFQVQLRQFFKT